jgi:hypothetical protein
MSERAENSADTYHVVLLVERALTDADAAQVRALHEGIEDPVVYTVLMPVEDAAAQIESAMGALSSGEYLGSPAAMMDEADLDAVRDDAHSRAQAELEDSLVALGEAGATASGRLVTDPVHALQTVVKEVDGREAIVLTRPHVVAEFFHVDWSAQARRHLDIPVLHLLEHESTIAQGSDEEGLGSI